ncbi:MAG: hydrolase [bacterium]
MEKCQCVDIKDSDWHLQDMDWSGKFLYYDLLPHFLGMPLGFEKKVQYLKRQIAEKAYKLVNPDMILQESGTFRGAILMEIEDPGQYDANVEQLENVCVLTRVYNGPAGNIKQGIGELRAFVLDRKHFPPAKIYLWYITCSSCIKRRGKAKVVLLGRL